MEARSRLWRQGQQGLVGRQGGLKQCGTAQYSDPSDLAVGRAGAGAVP